VTTRCPECLAPIERKPSSGKTFCCPEHKAAFHNRQTVRGRVLTPLTMAARITRGGSRGDKATGRRARSDAEQMVQRWIEEDRAEKRMSAVEYIEQRMRLGF
jgi:hypothetical protein